MQNAVDTWIETTEILRDAIAAEDGDRSFEALTILLMQLVDHAGPTHPIVSKFLPTLLGLKQRIQQGDFEHCVPEVLAILALFRATRASLDESQSDEGKGTKKQRKPK